MATKTLFTFFVLVFFTSVFCQTPKKRITEQDYHLWSSLSHLSLSNQGDWAAWQQEYTNITDSLFIKNTNNDRQYAFEKTNLLQFDEQDQHCLLRDNEEKQIILLNLTSGKEIVFKGATHGSFIFGDTYLAIEKASDSSKELILYNIIAQTETVLEQLSEYNTSFDKNRISWIDQCNAVWITFLHNKKTTPIKLLHSGHQKRKNLIWSDSGNSIAVMEEQQEQYELSKAHQIYYFKDIMSSQRQTKKLDLADSPVLSKEYYIAAINNFSPLQISSDEETIYFTVLKKSYEPPADNIQIWDSTADLEYPRAQNNDIGKIPKLTAWNTETGKTTKLQEDDKSHFKFYTGKNFALSYKANQYNTLNKFAGNSDIYLFNLKNKSSKIFLNYFSNNEINTNKIQLSPNQNYISYFINNNWFIYNIFSDKHINITADIQEDSFIIYDKYHNPKPSNIAFWTKENQLIISGLKKIWIYSPIIDEFENIDIIKQNNEMHYTIENIPEDFNNPKKHNAYNIPSNYIDLSQELIIKTSSTYWVEYSILKNNKLFTIIRDSVKVYNIQKAKNKNKYIYLTENTDTPTTIHFYKGKTAKIIYQINQHQKNFLYPKKELINYTDSKGKQLKGVLFYPTDFDSSKKYPMITHIYEKQSVAEYNEYKIPTLYNSGGFNAINYTSNCYFVFYPDITYEIGKPGYSALDCTEAGVKTVLKKGFIDSAKLGLIGHSFGGYEAAFIASQTELFKAIVCGAALSDLAFHSLTIDKYGNLSQTWRYLHYQMRMGQTLQHNYQAYLDNSPLYHAKNIKSDLLSWSGGKDLSVDIQQSIALNLALRNLKKEHYLLIFPNEGHIILNPKNQSILTQKIDSFFDSKLNRTLDK